MYLIYCIAYKAYFKRINFVKKAGLEHIIDDVFDFGVLHLSWTED